MNITEEQILRKYLRRKIAEKNSLFSRMSYKFKDDIKVMRYNIFTSFARGRNSIYDKTPSNLNFAMIRDHIDKTGNGLSPYNYFDLDTLIAYDSYLELIINQINLNRVKAKRQYYKFEDFNSALKNCPTTMLEKSGTFEMGYYNEKCPIKTLEDEYGRLAPERTPDAKNFEKKYSISYCEDLLQAYLDEKHPNTKAIDSSTRVVDSRYDFIYNNIKFNIDTEKYYLDSDSYPIKYITAKSLDENLDLRGFFDISMTEYIGDVYDMDGNYLYSREESGVDIFGKSPLSPDEPAK